MLCACIDIGSNTTRVLVADVEEGRLREVVQRRAFTSIGKGLKGGEIPREKIAEVAAVVAEKGLYDLDGPIVRVTGFDVPWPQFAIEKHALIDVDRIVAGIRETLRG